ncbi:MAG: hypothetical protein EXR71_00740 [Myxococcales bacterium]|nr:hypothetical protein [Myxococcales bacterium]
MLLLLFASSLAGDGALAANKKVPVAYVDDLQFKAAVLLEEEVQAVVPSTWVAQSTPRGSYEPPEGSVLGRQSEFRIGVMCGPSCKPVEDWTPVLEAELLKEMMGWTWRKERDEKSLTQRFMTARASNGTVQIIRILSAPGGSKAIYCRARLIPQGGGVTRDPLIDKLVPAFEEACLGMKL